jgi:TRAP-type C4-dicarboxylate transport system substrate-binding protein
MYLGEIMSTPRKLRWLIAHQPQELFVRTARAFKEELKNQGVDSIEIEILTYPEYREQYGHISGLEIMEDYNAENLHDGLKAFFKALGNSDIEMSQVQVGSVGDLHSDFNVIDLPFLFENHDHVSRVLEGEIGQELCDRLGETSPVRGIGFTYSGGYRVIGSNTPINNITDLEGLSIVCQNPITLGTTIESMGGKAVVVQPNLWNKHDVFNGQLGDAVETTYLRFNGNHILKTNHSMFMTTILISNKFWGQLTASEQESFKKAAIAASRRERQWSVEDAETYEKNAAANGVSIVEISEQDRLQLKHRAQITYAKCKYYFSDGLVKRIRNLAQKSD